MVFTNNTVNLGEEFLNFMLRCRDRGWKMSTKATRCLSQEDYEEINLGSSSSMDYKFSVMTTVLFVAMMYGAGIPVLYPIAVLYFFVTYWTNKFLIFNCYRKPEMLDESLPERTVKLFKYALALHMFLSMLMFSN